MPERGGYGCTICNHNHSDLINGDIVDGKLSLRAICAKYGISGPANIVRHRPHIPAHLTLAKQANEIASATNLLQRISGLIEDAEIGFERATEQAIAELDPKWDSQAVAWHKRLTETTRILGELSGQLQAETQQTINVLLAPEIVQLNTVIVGALEAYPEARQAVVEAIEAATIEDQTGPRGLPTGQQQ